MIELAAFLFIALVVVGALIIGVLVLLWIVGVLSMAHDIRAQKKP